MKVGGPRSLILFGIGLLAASPAWAACPAPTTSADVDAVLFKADQHFDALEPTLLSADIEEAGRVIGCLGEPLAPKTAAHLHRAAGLSFDLAGDTTARDRSFVAAGRAEPSFRFPSRVLSANNPTAQAFVLATAARVEEAELPAPADGVALWWDGVKVGTRPMGIPGVFQVQAADGGFGWSGLVAADAALPDYPRPPPIVAVVDPVPDPVVPDDGHERKIKPARLGLVIGGGALLAVGAASGFSAVANKTAYEDEFLGDNARHLANATEDDSAGFYSDIGEFDRKSKLYTAGAIGGCAIGAAAITVGLVFEW